MTCNTCGGFDVRVVYRVEEAVYLACTSCSAVSVIDITATFSTGTVALRGALLDEPNGPLGATASRDAHPHSQRSDPSLTAANLGRESNRRCAGEQAAIEISNRNQKAS